MSAPEQGMNLRLRSPLAKVDGVCLLTGKPPQAIYAMADGGDLLEHQLQWVWNVSTDASGKIRDLRFWVGEVLDPARQKNLTLDAVINSLVPRTRTEFPAGEVQQLLQVRHNTLLELRRELAGTLRAHCNFYPRAGLVKFFERRWLGANLNASPDLK